MAENKWLGTTSNDINAAGNWGDGVPTADDVCAFLLENTGPAGPGASMAAHTLIDLNGIYVGPGYTKDIGGSGNHFEVSADVVHYNGTSGKLWLKEGTAAGATDHVICDSSSPSPLTHDCLQLAASTFARLAVIRGLCTLETGCTVTAINVGTRNANTAEANLIINAGANAPTTVTQGSGIVSCMVNPTTLVVFGGEWTQASGGSVITTLEVWGGNVILQVGGTYATVRHFGGTIDCTKGGGVHTFTNYMRVPLGSTPPVLLGENNQALVSLPTAPPALTYIG